MSQIVPAGYTRRSLLAGVAALAGTWASAAAAQSLPAGPGSGADAVPPSPPGPVFGRYGSPSRRLNPTTLYVDPEGRGDHRTVQAAVDATPDRPAIPWTLVLAAGTYREVVTVSSRKTGLSMLGATRRARDVVVVFDNANGTPRPTGGTYGTSGSATVTLQADGFTAADLTFANDWLRADHPEITGTQAVAVKVTGDRSSFWSCRFLGHQDTLYADSPSVAVFSRQYFRDCYVEGDVDFVFGRGTAVLEHCELRTLARDAGFTPQGFVFAPSTAADNPHGFLAVRCRITSTAPDSAFCLARPWRPSSDLTALPMLVIRDSLLGPGIDAEVPYATMSSNFPWQEARFAEFHNTGPGAVVVVPENRPQLSPDDAGLHTPSAYLEDWTPRRP